MILPYSLLKIAHIVAVMIWVAGMFRLVEAFSRELSTDEAEATLDFDKAWTVPAMALAWTAGFTMAWQARWWQHSWFLGKIALAVAISALHGALAGRLRRGRHTQKTLHPLLLTAILGVVSLVILKPGF